MFAIERIKIIKDYLNKDKHVSVAKLSSLLNVTEVTIRRDLEKLESEGFLKRAHGGAVLNADLEEPLAFESSEDDRALQMMEISDTPPRIRQRYHYADRRSDKPDSRQKTHAQKEPYRSDE
jgi:DeoR/GlpR family transcriptional regulator of sugar metabolism